MIQATVNQNQSGSFSQSSQGQSVELRRAVLTLAVGDRFYFDMACNLARSFLWWNRTSDIPFCLVTDRQWTLPRELADVRQIVVKQGSLARGFSAKLYLDKLAPAKQTLFLDSDCLCFGPLTPVFDRFEGKQVSTIGTWISDGEFFGDVAERCRRFEVDAVPYFVGALYYIEQGEAATAIFDAARALEPEYDRLGMVRLGGKPNEEPLISVGMAKAKMALIPDDGTIKFDTMFWQSVRCDIVSGKVAVKDLKGQVHRPVILHFHYKYSQIPPYSSESYKLRLIMRRGCPRMLAELLASIFVRLPHAFSTRIKDLFRPAFHSIFGPREIQQVRP